MTPEMFLAFEKNPRKTLEAVIEQFCIDQDFRVDIEFEGDTLVVNILGYHQPGTDGEYLSPAQEDIETMWGHILNRAELADPKIPWRRLLQPEIRYETELRITFDADVLAEIAEEKAERSRHSLYESMFTTVLDEYLASISAGMHVERNDDVFSFYLSKAGPENEFTERAAKTIIAYLEEQLAIQYPNYDWNKAFFTSSSYGQTYINFEYSKVRLKQGE